MKKNILTLLIAAVVIGVGFGSSESNVFAQKVERRVVKLPGAPAPTVPISPAIVAGDFVFTSGTLGIDPKTLYRKIQAYGIVPDLYR